MSCRPFVLACEKYSGIYKHAVNKLSCEIGKKLDYVLPVMTFDSVTDQVLAQNNVIVLGKANSSKIYKKFFDAGLVDVLKTQQAYAISVGENPYNKDLQAVGIFGYDESGVLYGAMDFINRYLCVEIYNGTKRNMMEKGYFEDVFHSPLAPWKISTAPAIKTRALWTWGHVVYDYKKYFENMATLRLNEVVIWNDVAPINAKDVVEYAHSLGIKVIWGFAWGWGVSCKKCIEELNDESFEQLKKAVVEKYKTEYADTGADGIYFQSFTELHVDSVNGKCIAQLVTQLVNEIGEKLLEEYPSLHIQFGLHATSVKNKLEYISQVDKRISIVWEDCGAFPYHYLTNKVDDFEQTMDFTQKLLSLRGDDEVFGAVLKGMVNLDWVKFEHYKNSFVMGENLDALTPEKINDVKRIWKYVQADWLKNSEYLQKLILLIAKKGDDAIIQGLVEDSAFECFIPFPTATFAELLWNPNQNVYNLISEIAKYSCVEFANAK